jgi:hypothetical protein
MNMISECAKLIQTNIHLELCIEFCANPPRSVNWHWFSFQHPHLYAAQRKMSIQSQTIHDSYLFELKRSEAASPLRCQHSQSDDAQRTKHG